MRPRARIPRRLGPAALARFTAPALALALTAATAHCAHPARTPITASGGGPVSHTPISEPVRPPEPRVFDVHAALLRGALTTCNYRALVTGTLRVTPPADRSADPDRATYEPDLTVNAQVVCNETEGERHETHVLRGQRMTREQFLDALRASGSVAVTRGDHVCTVRPGFSFDGDAVYGYQVTDTCSAPVGGGPRTSEMTAQSTRYGRLPHAPGWHRRFPHPHALTHPAAVPGVNQGVPGAAAPTGPRMCPCPDNAP